MTQYRIAFNLQEFSKNLFLPSAWLVKTDKDGQLIYLQQRATPQAIKDLGILPMPEEQRCLEIVEILAPKNLEKKYQSNSKKNLKLLQILEDKVWSKTVRSYVSRHLEQYLDTITQHQLPLCADIESKALVHSTQINYVEKELIPRLSFRKVNDGVIYQFQFEENGKTWRIQDKNITPVLNTPAWLIIDNQLVKVPYINALMVVPFKEKYEMHISKAHLRTYFETFILKIVARVETLEARGFDIYEHSDFLDVSITMAHDFLMNRWGFKLTFDYGKASFQFYESRKNAHEIDFLPSDEIIIHKTTRNLDAENQVVATLEKLHLYAEKSNFLYVKDSNNDFYTCVNWLINNRFDLENQGFLIEKIINNNQEFVANIAKIHFDTQKNNDWFDIYGEVKIGDFTIPFGKFIPFIKAQNPHFPLPDGTYFMIPTEWFTKYSGIVQFGKLEGDTLRIARSQNALLNDSDILVIDNQEIKKGEFALTPVSKYIKATLRPYQLEGYRWMLQHYSNGLGACLADDMGLGKTLQTIALLQYVKEQKVNQDSRPAQLDIFAQAGDDSFLNPIQALIVLPASLVYNWHAELSKFAPHLQVYEHVGNKRNQDMRVIKRFDITLTTYQTALKDSELFQQIEWAYIILDESHYIKNADSQIFKAISTLRAKHKISLSGTPIENSLSDLWAQMQFINPGLLGTLSFFKEQFLKPIEKNGDEIKKEQLQRLVSPYLLRRTKEEVAKDLPELIEQIIYVEMTAEQAKRYEKERSAARNLLLNYDPKDFVKRSQVFNALLRLRQVVNHPQLLDADYQGDSGKLNEVMEHWETIQKGGHKMLLFSSFTKHLDIYKDILAKAKKSYAYLTGDISLHGRKQAIEQFREDAATQTFLISLKAGGTGLNLTEAEYVFILDPWWNPQAEMQAIARAHRIGQQKTVIAMKFITRSTIEEKILALQKRKAQLAKDILDNAENMVLGTEDLAFLLT